MQEFTQTQKDDIAYFRANVKDFLKDNNMIYKHIIISKGQILKIFDQIDKAVSYVVENDLKKGSYIIQQVIDENEIVNFI